MIKKRIYGNILLKLEIGGEKMKKTVLSILAVGSLISGMGTITYAATERAKVSYSAHVKKLTDFETANKKKNSNNSYGINNVTSVGGALSSWIENTSGGNITSKVNYNSKGEYRMNYTNSNATAYQDKYVRLNISTQLTQSGGVSTAGSWTPDKE